MARLQKGKQKAQDEQGSSLPGKCIGAFQRRARRGLLPLWLLGAAGIYGGCVCDPPEEFDDPVSTLVRQAGQVVHAYHAKEEIEPLKERVEKLEDYFNSLKQGDYRRHLEDIADHINDAAGIAMQATEVVRDVRREGLLFNEGLVDDYLQRIKAGLVRLSESDAQLLHDAPQTLREGSFLRFVASFYIDTDAAVKVGHAVRKLKNNLGQLHKALVQTIDYDLDSYSNNGFINLYLKIVHPELEFNAGPLELAVGLQRGDEGPAVGKLQQLLTTFGYLPFGSDDWEFGRRTEAALVRYQYDHAITLSAEGRQELGRVGQSTYEQLLYSLDSWRKNCRKTPVGLSVGDSGSDVEILQQRLIELGYLEEGNDDGIYGKRETQRAVRAYQRTDDMDEFHRCRDGRAVDLATCITVHLSQ